MDGYTKAVLKICHALHWESELKPVCIKILKVCPDLALLITEVDPPKLPSEFSKSRTRTFRSTLDNKKKISFRN